jgi:hypothetical protein
MLNFYLFYAGIDDLKVVLNSHQQRPTRPRSIKTHNNMVLGLTQPKRLD